MFKPIGIRIKQRSFRSSERINEKGDGPYRGFGSVSFYKYGNMEPKKITVTLQHSTGQSILPDNICIRFGTKLYRQIIGTPMGTNCAPLVVDSFLYCYERDFMDSLNHDNQADVIEAFNSTSMYLF